MEQQQLKYQIGNKTFIQKPLVLGQVNQLMSLLRGMVIPKTDDILVLIGALGNRLPMALAIVLQEEKPLLPVPTDGFVYLRDRDLKAIADDIEFNVDPMTPLQVADDFFDCNPIVSLLEKFGELGNKLKSRIEKARLGSIESPSSSPQEISQGVTA
jgi:hypothetical protein